MSNLKQIINQIDELPPLPDVALKLVKLTASLDTDISEIIRLVEKDQSITAKVLRMCNSSFYGLSQRVFSVQQAVVLLGYNTLYKIVLTVATSNFFKNGASGYGLTQQELWRHSVATAIASETLAQKFDRQKAQNAYVGGLLHDIGKVLISMYIQEDIQKILDLTEQGKTFIEAEQEILGMDHAMIAGKLARKWKFPEPLVESVKYHHEPHLAVSDKDLCAFTHLGNVVTGTIGIGIGVDSFKNAVSEQVTKTYPLDEAELEEIVLITQQRVQEAEDFILQTMGSAV
jgi:putative nucleotidyltransferase with HDIG domain